MTDLRCGTYIQWIITQQKKREWNFAIGNDMDDCKEYYA